MKNFTLNTALVGWALCYAMPAQAVERYRCQNNNPIPELFEIDQASGKFNWSHNNNPLQSACSQMLNTILLATQDPDLINAAKKSIVNCEVRVGNGVAAMNYPIKDSGVSITYLGILEMQIGYFRLIAIQKGAPGSTFVLRCVAY